GALERGVPRDGREGSSRIDGLAVVHGASLADRIECFEGEAGRVDDAVMTLTADAGAGQLDDRLSVRLTFFGSRNGRNHASRGIEDRAQHLAVDVDAAVNRIGLLEGAVDGQEAGACEEAGPALAEVDLLQLGAVHAHAVDRSDLLVRETNGGEE